MMETLNIQIQNVDRYGCGSFYYVKPPVTATDNEIADLICDLVTEKYEKHNSIRYFMQPPFFMNRSGRMKIVEIERDKDGKGWHTKRKGRKGTLYRDSIKMSGKNILTNQPFMREYSSFRVEWKKNNVGGQ